MDYKKDRERVTAIVPAYNEADRIGGVLSVLTGYGFGEIIVVVDDGSTDDIARKYNEDGKIVTIRDVLLNIYNFYLYN